MIRSSIGDVKYWNEAIDFSIYEIKKRRENLAISEGDVNYIPKFAFGIVIACYHQMLGHYSRGDKLVEISVIFSVLLDAWEESNRLGKDVWTEQQQYTKHAWAVNLDHYIVCFWLVGLALALDIPDEQWQRLLALIGNEGEDELLDRIIATRQVGRKIGDKLCHPKPYQRLLDAINAPVTQQPKLLATFVKHWYKELNRQPKKGMSELTAMYDRPYWYTLGNRGLDDSGYFGRWCVEAVAAVKAFGLDDSQCLGHEHYPGDLLRPNGPSTHPVRTVGNTDSPAKSIPPKRGFLAKLFGR